jgi:hypothetical protein
MAAIFEWEKGFWVAKTTFIPALINMIGLVAELISEKIAQSELFNGRNFSRLIPKLLAVRWTDLLSSEPLLSQGIALI